MKYLDTFFKNHVQDLYTENYNTTLREIKDLNTKRDMSCS